MKILRSMVGLLTIGGEPLTPPFFNGTSLPDELKIAKDKNQKEEDMIKLNCEFLAGLVGIIQDEKTGSFKPEIGWFVRKEEDRFDLNEEMLSKTPDYLLEKY